MRAFGVELLAILLVWGAAAGEPTIPQAQLPQGVEEQVAQEIRKLYSAEPRQRWEALQALGRMGGRAAPAVPFVAGMLGDEGKVMIEMPPEHHLPFRQSAVGGLAAGVVAGWCRGAVGLRHLPGQGLKVELPAVPGDMVCRIADSLVGAMKDGSREARWRAAQLLEYDVPEALRARAELPAGAEKLSTEHVRRIRAAMLKGWLGAIRDENASVRMYAARGLIRSGSPKAVDPLIAALKDADKEVRRLAAAGLGKLRAGKAVGPLIAALEDPEPDVHTAARNALKGMGPPAVKPLLAAIAGGKSPLRERAAQALPTLHDPVHEAEDFDALVAALTDKDAFVRRVAAGAIRIPYPPAIGPLVEALKDEVPEVRQAAAVSLGYLYVDEAKRRALGPLVELARKDKSAEVRAGAVWSVGRLGREDARTQGVLLGAMKDEAAVVRTGAAEAVQQYPGPEASDALLGALCDKSPDVRHQAAQSLGLLKEQRAVQPLVRLLADTDWVVRFHAVGALGRIGDARAIEPLISALGDADRRVREAAAGALHDLTGMGFGGNQPKWRQWWEEQGGKLRQEGRRERRRPASVPPPR
ncbi:MAG: hypothetical protein AMJ81_08855 [Phycisphaerae bacterium SM23_33]|nr:MAG: hypothetical protein AMJ81_08855 [Phycisphaerae bacterium SM23_33]